MVLCITLGVLSFVAGVLLINLFILIWLPICFFIIARVYSKKYQIYNIGAEGEELVANCLSKLGKSHYISHDVKLPDTISNIDHVVIGENGIFVIETKSHKGNIKCDGDEWLQTKIGRLGTRYDGSLRNPSKQVKACAVNLRKFIRKYYPQLSNLWVNSIVVFTNEEVELTLNKPTVEVLFPHELCKCIKNFKPKNRLTTKQVQELSSLLKKYSSFSC